MTARGVHHHETKKLGRRPPSNKPALQLKDHLKLTPDYPIADPPPNLRYPMDLNDKYGDCVVAGLDHTLQTIYTTLTGSYVNWTDKQIIDLYKTQNPDFDPSTGVGDEGMIIQDFLAYLTKNGVILGFARVNPHDEALMKAAIYIGLAIPTGEDLRVAQQDQHGTWDYVAGSDDWGGHCTTTVAYRGTPDTQVAVSWGTTYDLTPGFMSKQVEEAWFVLTQAHVDHPEFRNHFDLASFAAAYQQITGRTFPVPVPAPSPAPDPLAPLTIDDQVILQHIAHAAAHAGVDPKTYVRTHFNHYYRIHSGTAEHTES